MAAITPKQQQEVHHIASVRSSLEYYIENVRGWPLRFHQRPWVSAIDALIKGRLRTEDNRQTNKLLILAPPGSGKSDTAIETVEWVIGREVERGRIPQCGYVSYADDVAAARSVAIRNTVEFNEAYHHAFPGVHPAKSDGWGQNEWFLERTDRGKKDPALRAAGVTGGILSYRFPTIIVIDDPHDLKMMGATEKENVWRTYSTTIKTRGLVGVTPILLVCTRWAEDDLAGRILETEDDWAVVHTKALLDNGQSYWPPETLTDGTRYGIAAHELKKLRDIEPNTFITQYQAMPPSTDADVFKYWEYSAPPSAGEIRGIYFTCDTAFTDKARSSYNVVLQWLWTAAGRLYLADVYRQKAEVPRFIADLRGLWERAKDTWGSPPVVLVENRASGPAIVQILRQTSGIQIKAVDIKNKDLINRSSAASKWFESGRVLLPDSFKPWLDTYIGELKAFPYSKYNDQVAATCLILEYLFGKTISVPPKMSIQLRGW